MLVFISPSFPAVADSTLGSTTADQFTTASKMKENRSKALVSGNYQVDCVQYLASMAYNS